MRLLEIKIKVAMPSLASSQPLVAPQVTYPSVLALSYRYCHFAQAPEILRWYIFSSLSEQLSHLSFIGERRGKTINCRENI